MQPPNGMSLGGGSVSPADKDLSFCLGHKYMSQTDRQTDKATVWSITAYGDEIALLEEKRNVPDYVKEIAGGVEECPTTGRKHFQGYLQLRTQQRMSALKKWLPTAHLEVCRNKDALKKYAMKADTAVGEKSEWVNPQQYEQLHEWLLKAAKEFVRTEEQYYAGLKAGHAHIVKDPAKDTYIWATSILISRDISFINKYSNPQFVSAWRMYEPVLIRHARELLRQEEQAAEGYSITPEVGDADENLFSEVLSHNGSLSSQGNEEGV